jgi:ankyrin repeat protein
LATSPPTRALLDSGADPNETHSAGFTLLYSAVIANRTEVARLLIERGANVNAFDMPSTSAA